MIGAGAESMEAHIPPVPEEGPLVVRARPDSSAAEQFRVLLGRLDRMAAKRPIRVVAVTSSGRGEGRTTLAANLAYAAAQDGRPTVLVDADLRRPGVASLLELAPRAGVAEVLAGAAEVADAVARVGPLAVLGAGAVRDATAALRSPRVPALLEALRGAYALVVLDAPPALAFADGDRLVAGADAALLVVRAGKTPRGVVKLALEALGDRAAGLVLNGVEPGALLHGRFLFADPGAPPGPPIGKTAV
jgi:capsular exopolysaccharide synthesis family protein